MIFVKKMLLFANNISTLFCMWELGLCVKIAKHIYCSRSDPNSANMVRIRQILIRIRQIIVRIRQILIRIRQIMVRIRQILIRIRQIWSASDKFWSGFGKIWSASDKFWSGFGKLWSGFDKFRSGFGKLWSGFDRVRHACDSSPFHIYVCILYCIFFLTFTPHWENLFLLFEAQKNWARQLKSVTPFTGSCVWGGYILSNMPGPNLESIFHRQQKYICVALLHFSKVLKEGGGGLSCRAF